MTSWGKKFNNRKSFHQWHHCSSNRLKAAEKYGVNSYSFVVLANHICLQEPSESLHRIPLIILIDFHMSVGAQGNKSVLKTTQKCCVVFKTDLIDLLFKLFKKYNFSNFPMHRVSWFFREIPCGCCQIFSVFHWASHAHYFCHNGWKPRQDPATNTDETPATIRRVKLSN